MQKHVKKEGRKLSLELHRKCNDKGFLTEKQVVYLTEIVMYSEIY